MCPKVSDSVRKWFEVRTSSDKDGQVFRCFRTVFKIQLTDFQQVNYERSFVRTVRKKNTPLRLFLQNSIFYEKDI